MKTSLIVQRDLADSDKIPPQAKIIIETIIAKVGVGNPIDRAVLVKELTDQGKLQTRQDMSRIVAFYQPRLDEMGLMVTKKESEASDAKTPEGRGEKKAPAAKTPAKAGTAGVAAGANVGTNETQSA